MKKKEIIITVVAIAAVLLLTVILLLVFNTSSTKKDEKKSFNIGDYQYKIDYVGNVMDDYQDYLMLFNSDELKEKDFDKYNYAIVEVEYDPCFEKELEVYDYKIENNKLNVIISYYVKCGGCAPSYKYFLIPVDKNIKDLEIAVDYKQLNNIRCDRDVAYKPLIYLYPEKDMNIEVKLGNEKYLTTSYPKYNGSWKVLAKPNGDLIDLNTGRYLYGLYWEGSNHKAEIKEDGFVVKKEDTISFLEEKLSILGLTEKEADEFIIYWLPKLEENNYNYIRFETIEEINNYMPLEVNPVPDTIIRILMDFKGLDSPIEIKEQVLTTIERVGFTLVEWGGSIIY